MEIKCSERCGNLTDEGCEGMCSMCYALRRMCDKI